MAYEILKSIVEAEARAVEIKKQAVAQAENPGVGCVGTANFRNGCIRKAVGIGRGADHCHSVPPNFIIRLTKAVVGQ